MAQDRSENKTTATMKKMGSIVASQDRYFLEFLYHFLVNHRDEVQGIVYPYIQHMGSMFFFKGAEFKWVGVGTGEILSHRSRAEVKEICSFIMVFS